MPQARSNSSYLSEWTKEVKQLWEGRCFCSCSRAQWPRSAPKQRCAYLGKAVGGVAGDTILWHDVWALWWLTSLSWVSFRKEQKVQQRALGHHIPPTLHNPWNTLKEKVQKWKLWIQICLKLHLETDNMLIGGWQQWFLVNTSDYTQPEEELRYWTNSHLAITSNTNFQCQ